MVRIGVVNDTYFNRLRLKKATSICYFIFNYFTLHFMVVNIFVNHLKYFTLSEFNNKH